MKRTNALVFGLLLIPISTQAHNEIHRMMARGDTKAFYNLCNTVLFNLSKKDKKELVTAAKQCVDAAHLKLNNFTLNDAGRLALGIPAATIGVPMVLASGILPLMAEAIEEPEMDILAIIASPLLLVFGGMLSYIGIDNIVKVFKHHDNRLKYDRALAIEAMLRRIKSKNEKG